MTTAEAVSCVWDNKAHPRTHVPLDRMDVVMSKNTEELLPPPEGFSLTEFVHAHKPTVTKLLKADHHCCCCCCCCCAGKSKRSAECGIEEFSVDQMLWLDPNSFGQAGGPFIDETRATVRWRVQAPSGSSVTVQVRTRGPNGNPGARFPDWMDTDFTNQDLNDDVSIRYAGGTLGSKVEFRIQVKDASGEVICESPPDS